jgi:dTDP-4-amino-4,6-dideoxygalactose transaminase
MKEAASIGSDKHAPRDLAAFGGRPRFEKTLHVGRPNIGERDVLMERIGDILDRRWLTNDGTYVRRFERALCEYLGVRNCVAMCNGTVAMEIAVRALGIEGEVIVPSFTFVATAHCLEWQGVRPVFCDIDPETHCIDPSRIERHITPRTTAILGVHVWGRPCDIDALRAVADRNGLRLLFDAAHALGCSCDGRMIGGFGDAECLSFHATKFVNSSEGGAVTTNDDDLAEKMRLMRNFGFRDLDEVIHLGINGKMSEMSAAMGLTSLENIDRFVEVNRRNYLAYREAVAGIPGIHLQEFDESRRNNYQYVVLTVDPVRAGLTRDELVELLLAENVRARRYFHPGVHRMEPYASLYPHAGRLLPETEFLTDRVLVMPTGTAVDEHDIGAVCDILRFCVEHAPAVRAEFESRRGRNVDA